MKRFSIILAAIALLIIGISFLTGGEKTLSAKIADGDVQLIDVREPSEYSTSHANGAINVPLGEILENKLSKISKNKPVYVYCRTGKRATTAKTSLEKAGYKNVINLGGLSDWQGDGGTVCASTKPTC